MGGRGTNLDVHAYLRRSETEQTSEFKGIALYGNIKFLKSNNKSVDTPIFSHTPNRVYVTLDKYGKIKEIDIYDKNHIKKYSIEPYDKTRGPHEHKGMKHGGEHHPISKSHKNLVKHIESLYEKHHKEWNI